MKRYRVADGREVILPTGLARAPSGSNARFTGGETFDVDINNPEIAQHLRFLRGRIAAGDVVDDEETQAPSEIAPPAQPAPTKEGGNP